MVDIALNSTQAVAVRKAMVTVRELDILATLAPPGSTEHGSGSTQHLAKLGECAYGINEVHPDVLSVTSLCGVAFSQGKSKPSKTVLLHYYFVSFQISICIYYISCVCVCLCFNRSQRDADTCQYIWW